MSRTRHLVPGFLWLAALAATLQGGESVLVLTGAGGASTQIPVFSANPFQNQTTLTGVAPGAFQVLTTPDGQKNYLISNTGSTGISAYDQNFSSGHVISGTIALAPSAAALSPDGKRLAVIAGNLYIIDTATDTVLTGAGISPQGTPADVAFSVDSSKLFLLSNSGLTGFVTPVDLTTNATGTPLQLPGAGAGIAMAPNGFLYVTTLNRLFEINPRTLEITPNGTMAVNANPTKPVFTPDGKYALAINRTPITGTSVLLFDLTSHSLSNSFPNFGVKLDRLMVAGNGLAYGYASENNTVYDVTLAPSLNVTPSVLLSAIPTNVSSIAVSNEIPARTVYAIATGNGQTQLYKVDVSSNQAVGQFTISNATGQILAYANSNPTSGGATLTTYNATQIIQPGAMSLPLVARVQDSLGRPVFGARVDFTVETGGPTLTSAAAFTNSDGFAQTFAMGPATSGAYPITATSAGTPGGTFTVTVPGSTGCTTNCNPGTLASIKIFSGDGQMVQEMFPTTTPLTVVLTDATGKPAVGQSVKFTITQGAGTLGTSNEQLTDTNGQASTSFFATRVSGGNSYEQAIVSAASAAGTVNFTVTTVITQLPSGANATPPIAILLKPTPDDVTFQRILKGGAGTIIPDAIEVQVAATSGVQAGTPIQGVALNVSAQDDKTAGGTCTTADGGVPMTNAAGIAKCDLLLNNVQGIGALVVNIGGLINTSQVLAQITTGPPATVTKTAGDNQSAKPSTQLPQQLRVKVADASGNPLPNVSLAWTVTKGSATLSSLSATTDSSGLGSATVTLGANPGTVNVKVVAGTGANAPTATFTATTTVLVGTMTLVSGSNQTATTGQAFAQPLVVQVKDTAGAALAGVSVSFAVVSGSASLSAATATTDATGKASVTATAGTSAGGVVVNATTGTQSVSFTLTVRQAGPPTATFVNAASGVTGLTPCGISLAQATGLVSNVTTVISANTLVGPLPTTLQGVNLTVNGIAAPIYYVSPNAVAFQTPCEVAPGTATVVMTVNGGTTTSTGVTVQALQPGIFETTFPSQGSKKFAVLVRPDGSYVTPDNPARRGEQLKMFATGLGQVSSATATGRAGLGGQTVNATLLVGVNNGGVRIISAEYMEGEVGLYVVTFEVPADTQTGSYQPLALAASGTDGNSIFSNPSFFPIQ